MKSSTERAVDDLIASLSKADGDDFEQAREMLAPAHLDILNELAVAALVSAARQARRRATLGAERRAARPVARELTPEQEARWSEREVAMEAERVESDARHQANLKKIIDDYTESVRTAWTAELLGSTFTMKDGRIIAWGDATVEDHEERRRMFVGNARAAVEGAARHQQAIEELRERGARTLREMVGVAA